MSYYCGHCLLRRKRLVKVVGKFFGLTHMYMCPVCRSTNPLTKDEVLVATRKFIQERKAVAA